MQIIFLQTGELFVTGKEVHLGLHLHANFNILKYVFLKIFFFATALMSNWCHL